MRYDNRPQPSHLSKGSVHRLAEIFSDQLEFGVGGDLKKVVSQLGGTIQFKDFWDSDDSDSGSMDVHDVGRFDVFLAKNTSVERDRFTIAHELGHYVLHFLWHKKLGEMEVGPFSATRYGSDRVEWEANWFAAAFLMPEDKFKNQYSEFDGNLVSLASEFKVSVSAARVRAEGLELL